MSFIALAAAVAFGLAIGYLVRRYQDERALQGAGTQAQKLIKDAISEGEARKKELLAEGKEEVQRLKQEADREIRERKAELQRQERRLEQKDENLDRKLESLSKKEEELRAKQEEAQRRLDEIETLKQQQIERLASEGQHAAGAVRPGDQRLRHEDLLAVALGEAERDVDAAAARRVADRA